MKTFAEFEAAGAELYHAFARTDIRTEEDGRQIAYHSPGVRSDGTLMLERAYGDNGEPYNLDPVEVKEVLGGMAYALWQEDPAAVDALHLPEEVDLLVQAVKLKRQRVLALVNMDYAVSHIDEGTDGASLADIAVRHEGRARNEKLALSTMHREYADRQRVSA